MKRIVFAVLILAVGCKSQELTEMPTGTVRESDITSNRMPDFIKSYTVALSNGRRLIVESRSAPAYPAVFFNDSLTQPDGRSIGFECDHIADKIIDGALVKEITPYCASIHATAEAFWKHTKYVPDEFSDGTTGRWRRVQ